MPPPFRQSADRLETQERVGQKTDSKDVTSWELICCLMAYLPTENRMVAPKIHLLHVSGEEISEMSFVKAEDVTPFQKEKWKHCKM